MAAEVTQENASLLGSRGEQPWQLCSTLLVPLCSKYSESQCCCKCFLPSLSKQQLHVELSTQQCSSEAPWRSMQAVCWYTQAPCIRSIQEQHCA